MTVVTFDELLPPPRRDGVAWAQARVSEAPAADGPWTLIDTLALPAPLDPDPANPGVRELTTTHAALDEGWYQIVWVDGNGGTSPPSPPWQNTAASTIGTRPAVAEVASIVRARTKIRGGGEIGTFTTQTRPTVTEVEDLIDDALDEVLGKVQSIDYTLPFGSGFNAPGSDYERRIRRTVKLYAAILIELSYFPEQVRAGQSPVTVYQALYDSRIRALIAEGETGQAEGMGQGAGGAGSSDAPADAAWAFPEDTGGLVGWQTRW